MLGVLPRRLPLPQLPWVPVDDLVSVLIGGEPLLPSSRLPIRACFRVRMQSGCV